MVDPTPISDGLNAGIYAAEGDGENASLSAARIIPLIGDLFGKGFRWCKKLFSKKPNPKSPSTPYVPDPPLPPKTDWQKAFDDAADDAMAEWERINPGKPMDQEWFFDRVNDRLIDKGYPPEIDL